MSRKFYVQYRGVGKYATREDIFDILNGIDRIEDDVTPRLHDHVKVLKYAGSQDDGGCIAFVRDAADGSGKEYYISSANMPYCGSIGEWMKSNEFTLNRLRGR